MGSYIPQTIEEYLRVLIARAGTASVTEDETSYVLAALRDGFGGDEGFRLKLLTVRPLDRIDAAYSKARIESVMHVSTEYSRPLIKLALIFDALNVSTKRANELCDLYAIAVRELDRHITA